MRQESKCYITLAIMGFPWGEETKWLRDLFYFGGQGTFSTEITTHLHGMRKKKERIAKRRVEQMDHGLQPQPSVPAYFCDRLLHNLHGAAI